MRTGQTAEGLRAGQRTADSARSWTQREDFASGVIRCRGGVEPAFIAVFSLLWTAGALAGGWAGWNEFRSSGDPRFLIVLVFPAVGMGLLGWALRRFGRWVRYRNSELRLHATPVELGQQLRGTIFVQPQIEPVGGVELTIECLRRKRDSDGDTHDTVLWRDCTRAVSLVPSERAAKTAIPVFFSIPVECEPWDDQTSERQTVWQLRVLAKVVRGPDLDQSFDVPVFRTRTRLAKTAPLPDGFMRASASAVQPPHSRIRIEPGMDGAEFVFPPAGGFGAFVAFLISLSVTVGIVWGIASAGAPLIFPVVTALFGLIPTSLFLWAAVGEVRVLAASAGVRLTYTMLGWCKHWKAGPGEVVEAGLSVMSNHGRKAAFSIVLRRKSGTPWWIFTMLNGRDEADWVAREINLRLSR